MPLTDMQTNIKHVVHLMLENRGFDTLLGWLYADGAKPAVNIPPRRLGELPFHGIQSAGETWQPERRKLDVVAGCPAGMVMGTFRLCSLSFAGSLQDC